MMGNNKRTLLERLFHGFARLPLPLAHAIGALVGWLSFAFPTRLRKVTEKNISLCFPEKSLLQRRTLIRRALMETGKTFAETPLMWCGDPQRLLPLVRQISGQELMETAYARGKGVILAAPHLGCWEMIGQHVSPDYPMINMYRPPRQASLARLMKEGRQRLGSRLAPTDASGIKQLLQALKQGEVVGILPDQDPRDAGGAFADFFGIQANTMTLLSRLAAKSGATVLFCFAERLPRGQGYHLHYLPAPDGIDSRDAERAAAAINQGVEKCVLRIPEQYQWSYKRFRTRPEGEAGLY